MQRASFTYEIAETKLARIGGKPLAVEVLWDGDTHGWFLMMFAIVETGFMVWKKRNAYHLGNISSGDGDVRLFHGQVPPWPESIKAQEIAERLKKKFGIEIWFPSPNEPDDGCPRWLERGNALKCTGCGKLMAPKTSPHVPKDLCSACHIKVLTSKSR